MDHLLRNSENRGAGRFGRPVFQPTTSYSASLARALACARPNTAGLR